MTGSEIGVVAAALTAIALVNWYFFVAGRSGASAAVATASAAAGAIPEIVITVDGGYSPNTVRVPVGRPVRLVFDRRDDSSCSEEVVIPDFNVRRYLPTGERTAIEITPTTAGTYPFTCGMSMLRGSVVVDD